MEESLEKFVFGEHILRIDDLTPRTERLEKLISSPLSFPFRLLLRAKLERLLLHQKHSYEKYEEVKEIFDSIADNSRNRLTFNPVNNRVEILGAGSEIFRCNGTPVFYHSERGEETMIPVTIGIEDALLRIHKHPQILISPFDDFNVDYQFSTSFSLGDDLFDYFTYNQTEIRKSLLQYVTGLDTTRDSLFCGKPGRVYYRLCDALYNELCQSVFWEVCREGKIPSDTLAGRQRLNLYGNITIKGSDTLLYQGDFKVYNTYFPFFIRGSYDGERKKIPKPKSGVSIE